MALDNMVDYGGSTSNYSPNYSYNNNANRKNGGLASLIQEELPEAEVEELGNSYNYDDSGWFYQQPSDDSGWFYQDTGSSSSSGKTNTQEQETYNDYYFPENTIDYEESYYTPSSSQKQSTQTTEITKPDIVSIIEQEDQLAKQEQQSAQTVANTMLRQSAAESNNVKENNVAAPINPNRYDPWSSLERVVEKRENAETAPTTTTAEQQANDQALLNWYWRTGQLQLPKNYDTTNVNPNMLNPAWREVEPTVNQIQSRTLEARPNLEKAIQDKVIDPETYQNYYGIQKGYNASDEDAANYAFSRAMFDQYNNSQTGFSNKLGMAIENRFNQYIKDPYMREQDRWNWIQEQPEYQNAETVEERNAAEDVLGPKYDQLVEEGVIKLREPSPIVSSTEIRDRKQNAQLSAKTGHEQYLEQNYGWIKPTMESLIAEGSKNNELSDRANAAAERTGLSPYTPEGQKFVDDYIKNANNKANADAISELTLHLANLGYAPDTASYVAKYSIENNMDPEKVVQQLYAQQYGLTLDQTQDQAQVQTQAQTATGGGKPESQMTEADKKAITDRSKDLIEQGLNKLDAESIANYSVKYGVSVDEAKDFYKQARLGGMVYEAPAYDKDGKPNATMQAILNGEFSIDLEKEGLQVGTDYYEVARQGNAERILHLFDGEDGFNGLVIPKEIAKFIASNSNTAVSAGKVAVWGENGIQINGNPDNVELVKATGDELSKAVDALIEANPSLKQMIDKGLLTRDDIMNHFFKGITETKETTQKSYSGGGGSSKKSSSSGKKSYGGYGGGGGSSYSAQPTAKEQKQARINNIMKNWTF